MANEDEEDCCDLVEYYSDKCFEEGDLFKQPESGHEGDCLLCCLPMTLDEEDPPEDPSDFWGTSYYRPRTYLCCSKKVCGGCNYGLFKRHYPDLMKAAFTCPFCRTQPPDEYIDDEDNERFRGFERAMMMKRVEANDPVALRLMGDHMRSGGDYKGALGYYTKAAELGDIEAHFELSYMYWNGDGVEKDEEKEVYHEIKAAIGGHYYARYNLARAELNYGNIERAVKHFIIAANLGHEDSMKELLSLYKHDHITKEDYQATLRTHKAAIEAMKSLDK